MVTYTTYPNPTLLNFTSIPLYLNQVTFGLFAPFMLAIIFGVAFLAIYGRGNENALFGASVVTTFSAFLFVGVGVINPSWFFMCMIITLLSYWFLPKRGF